MEKDTYLSIKQATQGIYKDKGSKFLAFAYPVKKPSEVKDLLQALKKEHFSARHHCYSYRIEPSGKLFRANDDGEPSGTAGKPILGQLLSNDLTNTLIVVVRYFGGTLLGVSGLINAYKSAAADAISNSTIITHVIENNYKLEFDYPLQNFVMRVINEEKISILNSIYEMKCTLDVGIRLSVEQSAIGKLEKIEGLKITFYS
ncbi:MAG: YigZ family protein [Prolixibacteraceae bacterium]|jgi:uncharacterized YigZ family protein|nr:YigZ family protein [Prolixibacteraceae bacterium]